MESEGIAPSFLPSALDGSEFSPSRPDCSSPGEKLTGTHWIEGWGSRAGLEAVKKRKSVTSAGNRIPAAQPVARRYTY
jgi:hypothetical protein